VKFSCVIRDVTVVQPIPKSAIAESKTIKGEFVGVTGSVLVHGTHFCKLDARG